MAWLFGKKKKEEEVDSLAAPEDEDPYAEPVVPVAAEQAPAAPLGDANIVKISADVEKLKAQFSTFYELQKASTERFKNISEQIGGIRSMMMERDKDAQKLEAKSAQAIDLVKSVQPDKFMIHMQKMDSKIEAVRANLESNETIIKSTIHEIKEMRKHMGLFKGMEQVLKMTEESKKELIDIKKVQALVERHSDKVETIFSEMQKKFNDFIRTTDTVKDLDRSFKQVSSDLDGIKVKMSGFGTKKEVENLIAKFDDFEKYVSNIVNLINKRFQKLEKEFKVDFEKRFEESDKLLLGFKALAQKTPDLDKYFNLLDEEANKAIAEQQEKKKEEDPEKVKELGVEEQLKVPAQETVVDKAKEAVSGVAGKVADAVKRK